MTMGRGEELEKAGAWTKELGAAIVRGATEDLVREQLQGIDFCMRGGKDHKEIKEKVSTLLKLRRELVEIEIVEWNEPEPPEKGESRRILITTNGYGQLADYQDELKWRRRPDENVKRQEGDITIVIGVAEAKVQTSYPAVR